MILAEGGGDIFATRGYESSEKSHGTTKEKGAKKYTNEGTDGPKQSPYFKV